MIKDPFTQEVFEPKRITQRFANPQNRIKYHNEQAKKMRHKEAYVNKPLRINHRICLDLLKEKNEISVHREYLLGKGFHFGTFTHFQEYQGKNWNALYNFIFAALENDQIKIIKTK